MAPRAVEIARRCKTATPPLKITGKSLPWTRFGVDAGFQKRSGSNKMPARDEFLKKSHPALGRTGSIRPKAKNAGTGGRRSRIGTAPQWRLSGSDLIGGTAGCASSATRPGHAGRSSIAKTGIPRPSGYSGCTPLPAKAARRAPRPPLRPCGE